MANIKNSKHTEANPVIMSLLYAIQRKNSSKFKSLEFKNLNFCTIILVDFMPDKSDNWGV